MKTEPVPGYFQQPSIQGDVLAFVSEEDLWTVPVSGGTARRLTCGLSRAGNPALSPNGLWLAFTGRDEGHPEVYVMPAAGGAPRRLTWQGAVARVLGWMPGGREIVFSSNSAQPFWSRTELFAVPADGGPARKLPYGPASAISFGPGGAVVIGRHFHEPAMWRGYRGGTAGELWVDPSGKGHFRKLISLKGNLAFPLWVGGRIYFVSDHDGHGDLYSCLPSGKGLKRHAGHREFFARNPATDGARIVFQAGAQIHLYDPATGRASVVEIDLRSPRTERSRKFVSGSSGLEDWQLHPKGQSIALVSRGRLFTMGLWEGAAVQRGTADGVRYRLPRWLSDGKRLVALSDAGGEEALEVHSASEDGAPVRRREGLDLGRAHDLTVSPVKDQALISNHRNELLVVDLADGKLQRVDRSEHGTVMGACWSPDGRWVAYSLRESPKTATIKLWDGESGKTHAVTRPVLMDVSPAFDPDGKFLYFLSYRDFDPVYDSMHFDLGFPRGVRPYLVTLRKDLPSPFIPVPRPFKESESAAAKVDKDKKDKAKEEKPKGLQVDLDGISDRVLAFPVPEGRYFQIAGLKDKVLFSSLPIEGSRHRNWFPGEPAAKGLLESYSFNDLSRETVIKGITFFDLSSDGTAMGIQVGRSVRVNKAGEKVDLTRDGDGPGRKSGRLDLDRAQLGVDPPSEWRQIYSDAWRLQRDLFWSPERASFDWKAVYRRYAALLDKVASRWELTDLIAEMQGELGTSHAYVFGGDYRRYPVYLQGFLGADFVYEPALKGWKIASIVRADSWERNQDSPLNAPGLGIKEGDVLLSIGGRPLGPKAPPESLLVNRAGTQVEVSIVSGKDKPRVVTVRCLSSETAGRYRQWVERNRAAVRAATGGRCGYVHIPDMGPVGYAEFHRAFLTEVEREGLIIDVRYNGGGHVSELILEKLARKRLAYTLSRSDGTRSYPIDAPAGPMVALTNESAGSDGDVFSHAIKRLKLGPLVGTRTWGGVIGIHPRFPLADGGVTTQPEFPFWFEDEGFGIENFGAKPDIEVVLRPQDHAAAKDLQLERALGEIKKLLKAHRPKFPVFSSHLERRPTLP